MASSSQPEQVQVDSQAAAEARKQASATVARADVDHIHDDPDARASFLSTFSAEEERAIIRKVDWHILPLAGLMFLIKQVCYSGSRPCSLGRDQLLRRLTKPMPPTFGFFKLAKTATS